MSMAAATPPLAARPLSRPAAAPATACRPPDGDKVTARLARRPMAVSISARPTSKVSKVWGSVASMRIPTGVNTSPPATNQASQRRSAAPSELRNSVRLAMTSSRSTAGTSTEGATKGDRPATHRAENPKPEKPRTAPAPRAINRPSNTVESGGNNANMRAHCPRGGAGRAATAAHRHDSHDSHDSHDNYARLTSFQTPRKRLCSSGCARSASLLPDHTTSPRSRIT